MVDLEPIDASDLTSSEILLESRERMSASNIDGMIVRMLVKNVRPDAYRALDIQGLKRLGSSALFFDPKIERVEEDGTLRAGQDTHIGSLAHEYRSYISALDMPEEKKRRLMEAGLPYFAEGEG
jgi:hypothetical protein